MQEIGQGVWNAARFSIKNQVAAMLTRLRGLQHDQDCERMRIIVPAVAALRLAFVGASENVPGARRRERLDGIRHPAFRPAYSHFFYALKLTDLTQRRADLWREAIKRVMRGIGLSYFVNRSIKFCKLCRRNNRFMDVDNRLC